MFFLMLRRMCHFRIKTLSASVVSVRPNHMKYITIFFTFSASIVKSRLTCIILIITRIKVQAGNSKMTFLCNLLFSLLAEVSHDEAKMRERRETSN